MKTIFCRAGPATSIAAAHRLRAASSAPSGEDTATVANPHAQAESDEKERATGSDFSAPQDESSRSRPLSTIAGFPVSTAMPRKVLVWSASGSQSGAFAAQAVANSGERFKVRLVARDPPALLRNGVVRCGDLRLDIAQHRNTTVTNHAEGLDPQDLLVIDATVVAGLSSTIARTPPGSCALYTQNGVPTHEKEKQEHALRHSSSVSMLTSTRLPPGSGVTVAPGGKLLLDQDGGFVDILLQVLRDRGFFEPVAVPDIRATQFEKIALNCALNVIATLSGKTLGELLQLAQQDARAENLIGGLAAEVCEVATVQGIRIKPADQVIADVQAAMARFPQHPTSMRMAFEAGNPTEIEVLNGAISRLGRAWGVATPLNDLVTEKFRIYQELREADGPGAGFHERHRQLVALVLEELLAAA